MNVAVVGAGMAGISCARALVSTGHDVVVFERSRAVGGRMASPRTHGRRVDTGAAYFTVSGPEFTELSADWRERNLATEWTDTLGVWSPQGRSTKAGPPRWRAPGGLRSLVEDLADGLDVRLGHPVTAVRGRAGAVTVDTGTHAAGTHATATYDTATHDTATHDTATYDAVVLAMPDPQAARLLDDSLAEARHEVRSPVWEPIVAVSLGTAERTWGALDAMFVNGHPVLSLVADDGVRRGDGAPVLVAHTTTDLATRNPDSLETDVLAAVGQVLGVPVVPEWSQVHRWGLARPARPREQSYWHSGVIGLCGDGWGTSKVETAWTSGNALGLALAATL